MYCYDAYEHLIITRHYFPELPAGYPEADKEILQIEASFDTSFICPGEERFEMEGDRISFSGSWGEIHAEKGKKVTFISDRDSPFTRMMMLKWGLGLLLHQKGYLVIHGCSVVLNNQSAVLFSGENGAGKSTTTLAFLKAGSRYNSDDILVIDFSRGYPEILPSFPSLKIWEESFHGLDFTPEKKSLVTFAQNSRSTKFQFSSQAYFTNRRVPVKAVYYLMPADDHFPEAEKVTGLSAFFLILRQFYFNSQALGGNFTGSHFRQINQLLTGVPVFRMNRPVNFALLEQFVHEISAP